MPNSSREIRFLVFLLPAEKSWGEKRHEKQWRVETDGEEIQDENAARFSRESGPDEASEAKGTNLGRTFDFYLPNPHLRSAFVASDSLRRRQFLREVDSFGSGKLCEKKREENSEHITERGERNQRVLIGLSIKHKK
jgi:hypothetical protein